MQHRHILFDFDGVLVESNPIRIEGFAELFGDLPAQDKAAFMTFVRANGGLSRYGKIRHLYENILGQPISDNELNTLAVEYSRLVTERIVEAVPVPGAMEFLDQFGDRFNLAVVSGSDQEELRAVCQARRIEHYFRAILGSPKEKYQNITELLLSRGWVPGACVYVGDAANDRDAAAEAGVDFIGRDSGMTRWSDSDEIWIADLHELPAALEELSKHKKCKGETP